MKKHSEGHRDDAANRNNSANQRNPNNDAYWQSRGLPGRPDSDADGSVPSTPTPTPGDEKPE